MKDKKYLKRAMEDKLKLQSRANERIHKKTEEALEMVQKSRIYGELQSSGNSRRVRKGLGRQHPTSSESCRSSMVDHDEEMALELPSKRPEWSEWEEARGREEDAWRVEPEGETEVPETVIVADEVEGTYVDSKTTEVNVACKEKRVKKLRVRTEKFFG